MGVAPSHEVNSKMEGPSAISVVNSIPRDGRGGLENREIQPPAKWQPSHATSPLPKAALSQIRSVQKQRRKSQFNPHRVLASRDAGAMLAAQNLSYSLNGQESGPRNQQRLRVTHGNRVEVYSQRPISLEALPTTNFALNQPTSVHSSKSAPPEISTQQASDKLMTIGSSKVSIEEIKEAIDVIAAENDGDSLPAPWHETQMKIAQYLSYANSKTKPLECPPRSQGGNTSEEIACSHDDAYLERLYNLRTWNMYKLISDAREDDGFAPALVYPTYRSTQVHSDELAVESHDLIFHMD